MTEPLIPEDKTRLLLVEGPDDVEFFTRLIAFMNTDRASRLSFTDYEITHYGGKTNLANYLYQLCQDPSFDQLTHVGVVRDADFNTNAFQSICSALATANREAGAARFSTPPNVLQWSPKEPYILPLTIPLTGDGSLERLLVMALRDDGLFQCVDDYFICVEKTQNADIADNRMDKNRLRVFVAGKEVDRNQATNEDAKRNLLRNIYSMTWLPNDFWENDSFNDAKTFLTQLLAD